jgi:hypothetical protein
VVRQYSVRLRPHAAIRLGEMQPRGRRHTVGIVTGRAASILENRIHAVDKRDLLRKRHRRETHQSNQDPPFDMYRIGDFVFVGVVYDTQLF